MGEIIIKAEHYTDASFHDAFRTDLLSCQKSALILSPFLSQNRMATYYPVFAVLLARNVKIYLYSRTQNGQPDSLRSGYDTISGRLKKMGVGFFQRVSMHEKIGVLDKEILWHGSLNILSHSDTNESMLRFESPELVCEILTDLQIQLEDERGEGEEAEPGTQPEPQIEVKCPACGSDMNYFEDAGLWICEKSPSCGGTLAGYSTVLSDHEPLPGKETSIGIMCPVCGSPMVEHRGIFRKIECSSDACRFSFDRRLSAAIRRISSPRLMK